MTQIHPTAVIAAGAELEETVDIGPYCVIGPHVKIGGGTCLKPHVVVDGRTSIGSECTIYPFASIGSQTQDLKYSGGETFVEIGDGTTLRESVTVNSGTHEGEVTRIGSDCHIMAYAHVAHACQIGNHVIMANCATLAGDVIVEDYAVLGGMAGVHQFVRIGKLCILGGCTKVTQDCLPYMIIDGNPARVRGPNKIGLQRNSIGADAQRMLKQAYRMFCRDSLSTRGAVEKIRNELDGCVEIEHFLSFVERSERGIIK
jgi:UDP-N-acetylglucosamine acyltransferase